MAEKIKSGRLSGIQVDRRTAIVAAVGGVGGFFSGVEARGDELAPSDHACVDMPKVSPELKPEERANNSPQELAIALGKTDLTAADAPRLRALQATTNQIPAFRGARGPSYRAAYANFWTTSLIPDKTLRVSFLNSPAGLADLVMEYARDWSRVCGIRFDAVSDRNKAHIRVQFNIVGGHWSQIGTWARDIKNLNEPTMNLGFGRRADFERNETYGKWVIRHEFGHALGCIHEHNRPDIPNPFDEQAAFAYFRSNQGWDEATTKLNVIDRFPHALIRASVFDPKSLMHYQFPAQIMKDRRARDLNPELSPIDEEYAAHNYGASSIESTSKPQESEPAPPRSAVLTVNGGAQEFKLSPGDLVEGKFTVSAANDGKTHSIFSEGGVQVSLELFGPNDASKRVSLTDKEHGTPDLTNDVIQKPLAAGDYLVKARHTSPRGGGTFALRVVSEAKFGFMLPAIKPN